MHPKQLEIKNFTYELPDAKIAKYPLAERDMSKLLVYDKGKLSESIYRNISDFIPPHSLLIFNNTKVIQARLFFKNSNGANVEIFCLEPVVENTEMASFMSQSCKVRWKCMIGRVAKWKEKQLHYNHAEFTLTAEITERLPDSFIVEFSWYPTQFTFAEVLEKTGMMPIPPYLKRESEETDETRYQTVYARHKGSVAAPTAGLHFTESLIQQLRQKNIAIDEVTLHVGAGTFKPVKSALMQEHIMHAEWIDVMQETIENLMNAEQDSIIAVGTTSLRTIETLYWMGVKALLYPNATLQQLEIQQWDVYELPSYYTLIQALQGLLQFMKQNQSTRLICKTQILIAPPYKLKVARALITNFHQPNSTLLLLVAAVVGENWKTVYNYALENNFRFLSYGDGSLLFAEK